MQQVAIDSLADLRAWLERHHAQGQSVWLVRWKKPHPGYVPTLDIIDELLCFGWIDSLPRKLDDQRTMLRISPRNPASAWSKINKDKVDRLIAAGRMMPAGMKAVETAKANGQWTKLDSVDALVEPDDLVAALRGAKAFDNWSRFPPSVRRGVLEIVAQAKRTETRARRITEVAECASRNERPFQWRRP